MFLFGALRNTLSVTEQRCTNTLLRMAWHTSAVERACRHINSNPHTPPTIRHVSYSKRHKHTQQADLKQKET